MPFPSRRCCAMVLPAAACFPPFPSAARRVLSPYIRFFLFGCRGFVKVLFKDGLCGGDTRSTLHTKLGEQPNQLTLQLAEGETWINKVRISAGEHHHGHLDAVSGVRLRRFFPLFAGVAGLLQVSGPRHGGLSVVLVSRTSFQQLIGWHPFDTQPAGPPTLISCTPGVVECQRWQRLVYSFPNGCLGAPRPRH